VVSGEWFAALFNRTVRFRRTHSGTNYRTPGTERVRLCAVGVRLRAVAEGLRAHFPELSESGIVLFCS
jgi:hypothetical protein